MDHVNYLDPKWLRPRIIVDILDETLSRELEPEEWVGMDGFSIGFFEDGRAVIELMDTWGRFVYATIEEHNDHYLVKIVGGSPEIIDKILFKEFEIPKKEVEERVRIVLE